MNQNYVWRKKWSAHDPKYKTLVMQSGCSVLGWILQNLCLVIMTHDTHVNRNFMYANWHRNTSIIMPQDNDPKHTANTTNDFIWEKVLRLNKSINRPELNWTCISPPEDETKKVDDSEVSESLAGCSYG